MRGLLLTLLLLVPALASAQTVAVQGLLRDQAGNPVSQTTAAMTLRIYDAETGGTLLFTTTKSGVAVDQGTFDVEVGPLPSSLFASNPATWLEISVDGEPALPRTPFRWAPYALFADKSATAGTAGALTCTGCITASQVAPGAVTATSLGSQSVTAAKIAPGALESLGFVTITNLADVALSGSYLDLADRPDLTTYARRDTANVFTGANGFSGAVTLSGGLQVAGGTLDLGGVEAQNLRVDNAATAPATCTAGRAGQLWFRTTDQALLVCDGVAWSSIAAAQRPDLSVSPVAWDFGKSQSPVSKTFAVSNLGGATATGLTVTATTAQGFAISATTCGATLASGQSCEVSVTFPAAGSSAGSHTGALAVESSNAASRAAVLSGTNGIIKGDSPLTAGESCLDILLSGQTKDGAYYVSPPDGTQSAPFLVYCDMTTDGGGWTLVLNQTSSTYYTILSKNAALSSPTTPGGHERIADLLSNTAEIRYTDTSGTKFLHARLDGPTYWAALQSTSSVAVPIEYVSGPLSGKPRYTEVRDLFHWGHRHNVPYVQGLPTHVLDVYGESCRHVCWEDVNALDRVFAGDHCSSATTPSFCPAASPVYAYPGSSTRGGSFQYRKWVRGSVPGPGGAKSKPGSSCKDLLDKGVTQSGPYWVKPPGAASAFRVYCDQQTAGGGWTLILNMLSGSYYTIRSQNAELTSPSVPGGQMGIYSILPNITEIRYTDTAGTTFLHATIDGPAYNSALQQSASKAVPVQYLAGPLSGKTRYIEVRDIFHWGHRNNVPVNDGQTTGATDVYNNSCKHVCWEDVAAFDRAFLGGNCPGDSGTSFCPATGSSYAFPSSSARGGSFEFRKWVR